MITEASPILNLLLAKGVGTKTLSEIVDNLVARELSPEEAGIDVLADELRWQADFKNNALAVQEQADSLAEQLERQNVRILVRGFDPYPQKLARALGKDAPPVLFAKGNLSLLDAKAVGFCGSRHASDKGIHVAAESARQLGERGVDVVSGYAKGVDLAAHCAALEAGGTTTIVLAEGILHFRAKREIKGLFNEDNYLVLSQYSPRLPWAAHNAMQRNNTIIGLTDAMIVIESGTTGGTHACAEAAIRLGHPLFVADYAFPSESAGGNKQFLDQGALALRGDREGRPNLTRVFKALGIESAGEATTKDKDGQVNPPFSPPEPSRGSSNTNADQQPLANPSRVDHRGYLKRLIEVDLPIARISAHARREKSIRHGHISTLHIWWARRPLAACRAVICAALWPDPADPLCPLEFRRAAVDAIKAFARRVWPERITEEKPLLHETASPESLARWEAIAAGTLTLSADEPADLPILRFCLLDFIADFANWDNSTVPAYLETSRALTQAAHEALGSAPGTRPLVVDPFAGGGSIPLEALRVGADAFASDLNPVAVLLNKVVLEYIPKYGKRLAEDVRKWGEWIKREAEKELAEFYPKDADGATPIAYLWARTIRCEGPACGAEVPLIRSLWLAKKTNRSVALQLVPNAQEKRVDFQIIVKQRDGWVDQADLKSQISNPNFDGTVKRGSATCPCCGYTTPVARVREQLKKRRGGADSACLLAVVTMMPGQQGRTYRLPSKADFTTVDCAKRELDRRIREHDGELSLVPTEPTPLGGGKGAGRAFSQRNYGMEQFRDLFSARQLLALTSLCSLIRKASDEVRRSDAKFSDAVEACLSLCLGRLADLANSLCGWTLDTECAKHLFARQAISMVWNFAEAVCTSNSAGSWGVIVGRFEEILDSIPDGLHLGQSQQADASRQTLPDDIAAAVITDPPYYDAVPYADLSDFFFVWFRRTMSKWATSAEEITPKDDECIVDDAKGKDKAYFESKMSLCLSDSRRVLAPSGIATIVFAHKSTSGWEALLQSMCDAGWTVTASWPIDTEMGSRLRARDSAALASSVHLVCRPREDASGAMTDAVGEWRDVLRELPKRIHEWMPRLAAEGVVGADAIFACLGPALEIFSRYRRVEKANGDPAMLREYLEFVWAAVATEALSLIFKDADAAGLEPDARLTAMWLWTIGGAANGNGKARHASPLPEGEGDEEAEDEDQPRAPAKAAGFTLEFDAARKIAQGLGVHLEQCESLVEIKGDKARLLPVSERTQYLFGKGSEARAPSGGRKKKSKQRSLFEELDEAEAAEAGWNEIKGPPPGGTVLDRVHQAMILFAANRGELLKRFLVDDGAGKDARFWKLADNLNKLYPSGTDERRWVEGVLARKKGLGL